MPPDFVSAVSVIGILLLVMAAVWILLTAAKTASTVEAINCRLEMLMKHSGLDVQELASRELEPVIRRGDIVDQIQAIKRYRQLTGASLADTKAAVEKIKEVDG